MKYDHNMNPTRRGFLGLVAALAAAPAAAWRAVTSGRRSVVEGGRVFTTGVMEAPGPITFNGIPVVHDPALDYRWAPAFLLPITKAQMDVMKAAGILNRGADGRA